MAKGQLRVLAGVLAGAAVIVGAVSWAQLPEESSFAPSPLSQVLQQVQGALSESETLPLPEDGLIPGQGDLTPDKDADAQLQPPKRPTSYKAVREFREDGLVQGEDIESTGDDESAVAVLDDHATVTLTGVNVTRKSPSSTGGLLSSTYGVGAALLAAPGRLYVSDSVVATNAAGGAGLFCLGRSDAYIADSTVRTQQESSSGLVAVEGASLYSWDTEVRTEGDLSSPARIGSEGGTMVLNRGVLLSSGEGSPAFSSEGELAALDVSASSSRSGAVSIEGKNAVRLFDCRIASNPRRDSRDDCLYNVVLYQGEEADVSTGRTTFQMTGGQLSAREGGLIYVTNTQASIVLESVNLSLADDSPFFLRCTGNTGSRGWGATGNNGAVCSLAAIDQTMEGNILWDSLSQVTVYLTEGSSFEGAVVKDDSAAGNPTTAMAKGQANLIVDRRSSWVVTGDSTLSSLSCEGSISDAEGRPVTIKSPEGATFVKGTSPYTVTVTDFSIAVDVSSAPQPVNRDDYEADRPEELAALSEGEPSVEVAAEGLLVEGAEVAADAVAGEDGATEEPQEEG